MSKNIVVNNKDLEDAYRIMARIVRDHGERYLPVFKRLHDEHEARKAKRDLTNIALKIAAEKTCELKRPVQLNGSFY